MNPVRLGVVGCGVIGPTHMAAAAASPDIELVAVADLIEERGRAAGEKFKAKRVYRSGAELLDDPEVEAVVLAFPTGKRTELALQAFAKGKHVLVEKPVAMNAGEVRQMIAARGRLVAACCSSRFRFLEGARVAADFLASGALGDLRVVRCRNLAACGPKPEAPRPDWRLTRALNGGGYLVNWGCYDLDYLLGITGWSLKPRLAVAQTWTVPPQFESHIAPGSDAETYYIALVRCEGGAVLSIERGEYMPAHSEDAWQIIGTKGSLTLKMTWGSPKAIVHDDTTAAQGTTTQTLWQAEEDGSPTRTGPVTDFAAAIREDRPPATSLERALVIQQITDAIYASAAAGCAVEIE
ncbi:MAG: Gfo/Idh/MocA family oxidoreductase [Planctomycetes bacterium]|nr:Gfo/Idh/MocA family oxidoreductase [Planctomycetota bacterium]